MPELIMSHARVARYLRELRDEAREHSPQHGGRIPQTTLWWVSGDEYLGRISIRHPLTARLTEIGGHIGYDIRPSARHLGHATAMLAAALPVTRSLGIDPALLTCDEDNTASRKSSRPTAGSSRTSAAASSATGHQRRESNSQAAPWQSWRGSR